MTKLQNHFRFFVQPFYGAWFYFSSGLCPTLCWGRVCPASIGADDFVLDARLYAFKSKIHWEGREGTCVCVCASPEVGHV